MPEPSEPTRYSNEQVDSLIMRIDDRRYMHGRIIQHEIERVERHIREQQGRLEELRATLANTDNWSRMASWAADIEKRQAGV